MAAADVDIGYLATHLGVSGDNLTTVTTNPTVELVNAVLAAVVAKGHEYDALYSQKVQLEVELETNVRGAEAQRDASNETAKKALKDVEEIRQKLKQEETARQALENEIQNIRSSSSTSQFEVESLRTRIASLETSNREALAIIDTKNSANDTLSQELQTQHQKNLKLSQEISTLQQSVQNANNAASSAKFKEQSVQQQLDMANRSAEFFEKELKTKNSEHLKFRKEKGTRIAELQRINDDANASIESLKRSEQQLRKRLDEAQKKADEGWAKVQQLQETAARTEEGFKQELDSCQRLVNLKDQQTLTHKNRLQEVESRLEQVKRDGEIAVRRINEELAQAQRRSDEASAEIENLQAEVGRLEATLAGAASRGSPGQPGSAPQTPRPINGSLFGRPGSPFATPSSARKTISATQVLDEMYRIKGLLAVEKQKTQSLQKEMDDMMGLLESKGPELDELQAENERLQREINTMSHLSDESFKERDVAKKAARKAEREMSNVKAECDILRNQIRDLSAQMQMLMFNLEHQGQELTLEETLKFQQLEKASGFMNDEMSDVDALVMERLVVFKDIKELQEKNLEQLKVIHELSGQMNNPEDEAARKKAADDAAEVDRLREKIKTFEDELRSIETRAKSIIQERDMFRRMIEDKASGEELASGLGREGVLASIEQNSTMNEDGSDYTALLRDLQQNFDSFRQEQATDRETMKTQIERLSSEKNSLQADIAKTSSQLSLASERYEMLQSNFVALQSENKELQKRNQSLSESAAKQDIRTQQVAEDLVEARGLLDSIRNENANLKAEKKLWKDIQDRLSQDNDNLIHEKSRLNSLLATNQTLQNERDLTEAETKRRLQAQIDSMEADLTTTRRKLTDEVEESKKLQLRKEFDSQQSQKRIDELTSTLSQIREELVATKTSRDHLQARVDELTIELRSAEERTERLQPRPTPRPGSMATSDQNQDADERIQELIHEVTDLKRDLELAKTHLENAKAQAEQYKELSQAAEEELNNMSSTQDQYVQEMDAALNTRDTKIKELEQRVEDLSAELGRSNGELSSLRDSQAEIARHFQEEKALLEEDLTRLKNQDDNYTALSQCHQQDLRAQAEIASNAQQAYESEVAKHGETAKTLSSIRAEYNQMKIAAATLRAEAESAKATLLQNESSWDDRRKKFEQELTELRARRDDANAQNKLLHQQLENVTSQISALQESRASTNESLEAIAAQPSSSSEDGLREINNYLRREKDILEVQFDLKVREAKRLQEQLDYTHSQLDEARLKLEQERRTQADSERSSMSYKDLMEKLEELNLFRESSATLRAEARQAHAQVAEKMAKITELESKVQPLEAQIEELQSQHAFKETEIKQLQEDRDRWQKRTEDILSKHGRTDPAEVDELKQTVANLEAQRNSLQEAEIPLKEKIQQLEKTLEEKEASWQVTRGKLIDSAKEKARSQNVTIREGIAEKERLQNELNDVNIQLTSSKEQLDSEKKERLAAEAQINGFKQQVQALQDAAQQNSNPNPPEAESSSNASNQQQVADLEKQLAEMKSELGNVTTQKANVEQELESTRTQLDTVIAERDQALANAKSSTSIGDVTMENGTAEAGSEVASAPLSDEERAALEQKIAELEEQAATFEAKAKELEDNQDAIVRSRSDKMKATLNKRLQENREEADTKMMQELDKQQEDFKLRLEQERKIWEAEHNSATAEAKPPATTSEHPTATPSATASGPVSSLSAMPDTEVRDFINSNSTALTVIKENVRKMVEQQTRKLKDDCAKWHISREEAISKAELDQKLAQAREQATKLAASKAGLQLNLAQNQAKIANAKLGVVETAAKDTPKKPVGEVWAIAKEAKPVPAHKPQATPAATASAPSQQTGTSNAPSQVPKPTTGLPRPPTSIQTAPNPFSNHNQPEQATKPAQGANGGANPFAASGNTQPPSGQQPATQVQANQPKSGIPQPPKANLRQVSNGRGGRGAARGGQGSANQTGRASLNPGADHFTPGEKRPRGDSEAGRGGGAKRARAGAGGRG